MSQTFKPLSDDEITNLKGTSIVTQLRIKLLASSMHT